MSEKRFVLEISSFSGKHLKFLNILDNGKRLKSEDIVDLLNEQLSIIRRDEMSIKTMMSNIEKLEKDNEQLQKQVESSETTSNATSHYNAFLESKITTLEKENEQLKRELHMRKMSATIDLMSKR